MRAELFHLSSVQDVIYIYSYMQMITHLWLVHSPTLLLPGFYLGLHSLPLLLVLLLLLLPSSHVMEEEAGEGEQEGLHATALLKECSSSSSEWSLGLTPNSQLEPPTLHLAPHFCASWFNFTPG